MTIKPSLTIDDIARELGVSKTTVSRAISGKGQMVGINQPLADRKIQELLLIETENKKKRIIRFQLPAFQKRKKFGSNTGRVTGSLIAFLFPFWWFHFREAVFWGKVAPVILPDTGKEIIKSTNYGKRQYLPYNKRKWQ